MARRAPTPSARLQICSRPSATTATTSSISPATKITFPAETAMTRSTPMARTTNFTATPAMTRSALRRIEPALRRHRQRRLCRRQQQRRRDRKHRRRYRHCLCDGSLPAVGQRGKFVLQGSADFQAYGNGQTNAIYGNAGNNILNGGPAPTPCSAAPATTFISSTIPAMRYSRIPARDPTRFSPPRTSGCRRTWKTWCCKAAPTCRATATARRTRFMAIPETTFWTAAPAPTPMVGGAGNDTYFVDDANDTVFENANEGTDVVFYRPFRAVGQPGDPGAARRR